ncbi:MAG: VanZ family protein [Planctomycetes bacterium]|nr:VanZ family protein [Planctomycetota bacterium]
MALSINYGFIKKVSLEWRWGIVAIYTGAIYAFLPFGTAFWVYVLRQWGNSINYLGLVITCVLGTYFLIYLIFQKQVKKLSVYLAFFAISCACLALLKYMCVAGAERFHLLLYGILSVIVFWALKLHAKGNRIYLYTIILVFLLGAIDEFIQGVLPMRVFDTRDIFMNWLSSGMGELFIIFVLRPNITIHTPIIK